MISKLNPSRRTLKGWKNKGLDSEGKLKKGFVHLKGGDVVPYEVKKQMKELASKEVKAVEVEKINPALKEGFQNTVLVFLDDPTKGACPVVETAKEQLEIKDTDGLLTYEGIKVVFNEESSRDAAYLMNPETLEVYFILENAEALRVDKICDFLKENVFKMHQDQNQEQE